jgi:two-component system LytT family response regulator
MIKVLVVDDENKTREFIAKLIRSFGLDLEVIAQGENVETAIEAIQEHKPNLVLLDIQMPDGTGFDVLKRIESKNFEVIFITAHQEFAIKAIKFSALDYILKPVDPEELRQAIEMAIQSINSKKDEIQFDALNHNLVPHQKRKLVLKTQESVFVVELDDIIRCEADKNYTFFFLSNGKKILVSKTLKDFETLLAGHNFFRIQQSHLININYVERYDKFDGGSVIMKDGASVPLSQAKKEMFFQLLENL